MTDSIHVADGGEVSWIPGEHAERIAELESLVRDFWVCMEHASCTACSMEGYCKGGYNEFEQRMKELGIEVDR